MANPLVQLLTGGFLSGIKDLIGAFVADPNKKLELEAAAQAMALQQAQMIELTLQKELDTKQAIMVAELKQADTFTKRARPTVVYAGLVFIAAIHVAFPILAFYTKETVPEIALPAEFWWAWTGVVGAYVLGRSFEKAKGVASPVSALLTGSTAEK